MSKNKHKPINLKPSDIIQYIYVYNEVLQTKPLVNLLSKILYIYAINSKLNKKHCIYNSLRFGLGDSEPISNTLSTISLREQMWPNGIRMWTMNRNSSDSFQAAGALVSVG